MDVIINFMEAPLAAARLLWTLTIVMLRTSEPLSRGKESTVKAQANLVQLIEPRRCHRSSVQVDAHDGDS